MRHYGISDVDWERIAPLLQGKEGVVGRTAQDNRQFILIEVFFAKILGRFQLELNERGLIYYSLWEIDSHNSENKQVSSWSWDKKGNQIKEGELQKHALSRSRCGFRSNIHWVNDSRGLPLEATVNSG